jgi:hypothetical protein
MRKLKILLTLVISVATLGLFAQVTEKQKKNLQIQKKQEIKPVKQVEYPGVEWKPKQDTQEYPGVDWMPKQDSLQIMRVGDNTQAGIQARLDEAKKKTKEAKMQFENAKRRVAYLSGEVRKLERQLAELQGDSQTNNGNTEPAQEQIISDEQRRARGARHEARPRSRARREALEKAKDFDELERIVAIKGKRIKFGKDSKYISIEDVKILVFLIDAVNINGHAKLVFGVKKKSAGLANARVKNLKTQLAEKGLVPKRYSVSKLKKKAKAENWLSQNNHLWIKVERL